MTALGRSLSVGGMLGCVSGPIGFGRIQVLGHMPGLCSSFSLPYCQGPAVTGMSDFG